MFNVVGRGCRCFFLQVYSSCTGFSLKEKYPGAGSVQLASLGRWLERCGLEVWDLGMEMSYKLELGCKTVPRDEWARLIRSLRDAAVPLHAPQGDEADAERLLAGAPAGASAEECSAPEAAALRPG